ncbi:hypothetical protein [Flaviflexus equikiangi]|uniref:hypothetical protein n=1 Tax=Flaviflexus equikiangi TaxID=2758573 RepID=UPI0015F5138A|nr:hypothetical protein [Flaviflexus equikiangi]
MTIRNAILRAVPGAYILNSGINKLGMDEETAAGLQRMAAAGVPIMAEMTPAQFGKFLSYGETAVGAALLLPFVPSRLAGAALATFGAGLMASYFALPDMTLEDGVRPSEAGTAVAKDSWLVAIGAALMLPQSRRERL